MSIQIGIAVYCFRNRQQRGMRLYLPVIVMDALLVLVSTIKFVTIDEDMNTLMERLESDYARQAAEQGVALQVVSSSRASLDVAGDEAQLYEAMSNLVGNAIKYTPPDGNVRVMMSEKAGAAQFEVVDTGLGIPQAQHERLFQPFYRALRGDIQAISGTGLGLYLVKSIVTRHGGQMIFHSAAGQGSTFGFTLPLVMQNELKPPISTGSTETLMRDPVAITPAWGAVAPKIYAGSGTASPS